MSASSPLHDVIRETFVLDPDADVSALEFGAIEAWDSVGHMVLMAALESAFDVVLDLDEVPNLTSTEKIAAALKGHGVPA